MSRFLGWQARPDAQTASLLAAALEEGIYLPSRMLEVSENLTFADVVDYGENLQSALLQEMLSIGDDISPSASAASVPPGTKILQVHIHAARDIDTVSALRATLPPTPHRGTYPCASSDVAADELEEVTGRSRVLPASSHTLVALSCFNSAERNHAYTLHLQLPHVDTQSPEHSALLLVLRRLWAQPCFHSLRTQQQLGYVVSLAPVHTGGGIQHRRRDMKRGLRINVLSKRFDPSHIETQVEEFLAQQVERLLSTDEEVHAAVVEEVRQICQSIIVSLQDPAVSFHEEASDFWSAIRSETPFDYNEQMQRVLQTISCTDLQDFVRTHIVDPSRRCSLSIAIFGNTSQAVDQRQAMLEKYRAVIPSTSPSAFAFDQCERHVIPDVESFEEWYEALPYCR